MIDSTTLPTLTPITAAERAVLDAARGLARAQAEVESAMDAWMAAGEAGDGTEWDRMVTARRVRNHAADHLYDVASREMTGELVAADVPNFLRHRLPSAPAMNGSIR